MNGDGRWRQWQAGRRREEAQLVEALLHLCRALLRRWMARAARRSLEREKRLIALELWAFVRRARGLQAMRQLVRAG